MDEGRNFAGFLNKQGEKDGLGKDKYQRRRFCLDN
jgi:hypothetical protein